MRDQQSLKPVSSRTLRTGEGPEPTRMKALLTVAPVYLEFAKKSFQRQLQYKTANYAGFIVNVFFFVVRAYVFMALYENRGVVAGYDVVDAITYAGLTQAMIMTVGIFGRGGREISEAVRSGQVATDLMKPIDYQFFAFSRQLGRSLYFFFFRGLPIFVVMVIFFQWNPPQSWQAMLLFLPSLALAAVITFSFSFIAGISAFWLMDVSGVQQIIMGTGIFLSGFLIPLSFFPSGFDTFCEWLPFAGQSYVPVAIYLGKYVGAQMVTMLMRQVVWAVILIMLSRAFMSFAVRKLVIQGG
ncbi:ABC transporter permease [Candidatus Poribacteria bacterium]